MLLRMTIQRRTKSQTWVARKAIPKDVQDDYARVHGHRWEAKTTFPAALLPREAKAKAAEWASGIEQRIEAIRADQRGERQSLSQKQLMALAGEWYKAFTSRREENPGQPEQWEERFWLVIDRMEEFAPEHFISQKPQTSRLDTARSRRSRRRPSSISQRGQGRSVLSQQGTGADAGKL